MLSDGSGAIRISADGFAAVPSWAPDGRRVAFIKAEPQHTRVWNLWIADLARGTLRRDKVVVTSMTNLGFHRAMEELGIQRVITDVGDRYVLAAMREHDLALAALCRPDGQVQPIRQQEPVRQSRQRIVERDVLDARLVLLRRGDVDQQPERFVRGHARAADVDDRGGRENVDDHAARSGGRVDHVRRGRRDGPQHRADHRGGQLPDL